jgi:hypothetical protein
MAEFKRKIQIPEADIEKENTLVCLIERQFNTPNETNKASVINALKDSFVYIPVKPIFSPETQEKIKEQLKNKQPIQIPKDTKFAPAILKNEKGDKIMPWFSREEELGDNIEKNKLSLIRIPAVQAAKICDKHPEAFDIGLDFTTHLVKLTLDEIMEGFGLND